MTTLKSLLNEPPSAAFWVELRRWWQSLDDDRGARARLRRAKTPDEVFVSPDYQRGLLPRLKAAGIEMTPKDAAKLAIAIGVLVHAEPPLKGEPIPTEHFALQLAPKESSQESVRDPRFKKLLSITEPEPLFLMLRRLVAYLGKNKADLRSLVTGACDWTDKTRRAWAIQYYVNRPAKK